MKVKDLIKELEEMDLDAEVVFSIRDGCCSDQEDLKFSDLYFTPGHKEEKGYAWFYFDSLWFFDSCLTGGRARDAALKHKKNVYGDNWKPGDPNKHKGGKDEKNK